MNTRPPNTTTNNNLTPRVGAVRPGRGNLDPEVQALLDAGKLSPNSLQGTHFAKEISPRPQAPSVVDWLVRGNAERRKQLRWHPQHTVLNVALIPEEIDTGLVEACCLQWSAASNGLVRFAHSLQPHGDIVFELVEDALPGKPNGVGYTDRTTENNRWITSAHISIVHTPAVAAKMDDKQKHMLLHATILHELGHALGLDHSQHKHSAMHANATTITQLSDEDTENILALYGHHNHPLDISL